VQAIAGWSERETTFPFLALVNKSHKMENGKKKSGVWLVGCERIGIKCKWNLTNVREIRQLQKNSIVISTFAEKPSNNQKKQLVYQS